MLSISHNHRKNFFAVCGVRNFFFFSKKTFQFTNDCSEEFGAMLAYGNDLGNLMLTFHNW